MVRENRFILYLCLSILFLLQCERPNSPDFTFSRTVEFPVIQDRVIPLMGGSDAFIDTTGENLQDLFQVDAESFITLTRDEQFEFGNLSELLPKLNLLSHTFSARIGEIRLDNVSSQQEPGSTGFTDLTGMSDEMDEGDTLPAGDTNGPVTVDLETDYLVSATIIDGDLQLELQNELGFDITNMQVSLISNSMSVGSSHVQNLFHDTSELVKIPLSEGTVLEDLNLEIEMDWNEQPLQSNPGKLAVSGISGINLIASEAEGIFESQETSLQDEIEIDEEEIRFDSPQHFVELDAGILTISNIENELDIDIEAAEISFPNIRSAPFGLSDSLVVSLTLGTTTGLQQFENSISVDLDGYRIYGENNRLEYHLFLETENIQDDSNPEPRTLNENHRFGADIALSDITIRRADGIIRNRQVFLNNDDPINGIGIIDLHRDNEAKLIEIEGLQDFSGKIDGLEFTDARFSIRYDTNVDIPMKIIGAFMGSTPDGQVYFLSGKEGEETFVDNAQLAEGLFYNGMQLDKNQLIQFDVDPSSLNGEGEMVTFTRDNSNISVFLNRLPSSIRFIGKADLNQAEIPGSVTKPVEFEPAITIDIPLNVQTLEQAVYSDTIEQNLENLPGEDDDTIIEEATLSINYHNRIPISLNLNLDFLDEQGQIITSIPVSAGQHVVMQAAQTGLSGFSSADPETGRMVIPLNSEQLKVLNTARQIQLRLGLETFNREEVRLRSTDDVTISVSSKFILESAVK